jgi:hypothetical protein
VLKLISWKHSFKRLNEEYELAKKKKQALDNLFENGRISQTTRDSFDSDINAVIVEIEKQQRELVTKMQGKTQELESQIKTLEMLLANYEIQHVVGEIDEDMYQREITLLSTGLESARNELNVIKEATNQLCPPAEAPATEPASPVEETVEAAPAETVEAAPEAPAEVAAETCSPEPVIAMEAVEEAAPEAPAIETAYIAPEETPQIVEEAPAEVIENPIEVTEEMPETTEYTEYVPQEIVEEQPQVTEEAPQDMNEYVVEAPEVPEVIEDNAEITEETAQPTEEMPATEETSQETYETYESCETCETCDQPEVIQETLPSMDETPEMPEITEDAPEELSQDIEIIEDNEEVSEEFSFEQSEQPEEEMPQVTETEPQIIEENIETVEETPTAVHPSEAPKEAPPEVNVEVIADEGQSDEETAEAAEADDETEYEEL